MTASFNFLPKIYHLTELEADKKNHYTGRDGKIGEGPRRCEESREGCIVAVGGKACELKTGGLRLCRQADQYISIARGSRLQFVLTSTSSPQRGQLKDICTYQERE